MGNGESGVTDTTATAEEQTQLPAADTEGLVAYVSDRRLGFMVKQTRDALVNRMADDPSVRRRIRDEAEAIRNDLLGDDPTPLERLLVDRICITWLEVQYCDFNYGVRRDLSVAQSENAGRYQDRVQRRHLAACKALAQVRKLEVNIQINLAEKQVVMGGPAAVGAR